MRRSVRHDGVVTVSRGATSAAASATATSAPRARSVSTTSSVVYATPTRAEGKSAAISTTAGCGRVPTSVTPGSAVPPASSTSSWTARSAASSAISQSTPRSLRFDASEGRRCRRRVRAIDTGSKFADSTTIVVVASVTSVAAPPMTPARPMGPESSVMSRSSGSSSRSLPSRVVRVSPARARRTTISPESVSAS